MTKENVLTTLQRQIRFGCLLMLLGLSPVAVPAQAQSTVNSSLLITNADANVLANYLGQGPLDFTKIFTKTATGGQTATDFHNVADGMGPTFTVYEAFVPTNDGLTRYLIGGYDPQSWDTTTGGYHIVPNPADQTAFLFNLTTGTKLDETVGANGPGQYQTMDDVGYGPTFGGGIDLLASGDFYSGIAANYSYGTGPNIFGKIGATSFFYGDIETFTFKPAVVPESSSVVSFGLLLLLGFGGVVLCARKRTSSAAA